MDSFNSQNLSVLDAYHRKFQTPGNYKWGIGAVGTYTITVTANPPSNNQTPIQLTYVNGVFQPDQPAVTVNQGDWISWQVPPGTANVPAYSILGDGPVKFNSRSLGIGDMFSHIFVQKGTYPYLISGGAGGPQNGTIQVGAPPSPPTPTGKSVNIKDGSAPTPDPVAIVSYDTIIWIVNTGSGFRVLNA